MKVLFLNLKKLHPADSMEITINASNASQGTYLTLMDSAMSIQICTANLKIHLGDV